jgi:hypothetical protein
MYKILFTEGAYHKIDMYSLQYRKYFEELYGDTWIWNERTILDNYTLEAEERYFQIVDTISEKLSNSHISFKDNETLIKWRSKILLVSFIDSKDTRIITDLDIR